MQNIPHEGEKLMFDGVMIDDNSWVMGHESRVMGDDW